MADFVFTSPGVKFKERDLTYVTNNVGLTTLGLAGETLKGPAFEPVYVQNKTEFSNVFGGQSIKRFQNADKSLQYQLPYVADSFLDESKQLWVTRVLGLSGYDAGDSWNIIMSGGVDLSNEVTVGEVQSETKIFSNSTVYGISIYNTGITGTYDSGYTKNIDGSFTKMKYDFTVTEYDEITGSVTVSGNSQQYSAPELGEYNGMVVATIRSRGLSSTPLDSLPITTFAIDDIEITNNNTSGVTNPTGDILNSFTINAKLNGETIGSYTVSLDSTKSNYLPTVIGSEPKDKNTLIWVEKIYPDLIKKIDEDNLVYSVRNELIKTNTDIFSSYKTTYKTPETPWVVSQLKGNTIDRLFKLISISDGDSANSEIKISITNIDPYSGEFNLYIRDFYDTDANPTYLETYSRCNLIKTDSRYIGQLIGTIDGEFTLKSKYIMVEMGDDVPETSYPSGFEGYMLNNYSTGVTGSQINGVSPKMFYNTEYTATQKVKKTYLGVSEIGLVNDGINQNMFNFNNWYSGQDESKFTKSKGFHMDSSAVSAITNNNNSVEYFEVGAGSFSSYTDVDISTNPYYDINKRKFTLVPAGGFDGWDVNRTERTHGDMYVLGGRKSGELNNDIPTNDFQAWEMAINTFSNPENISINLFATPGIDWANQTQLIENTITMIEEERTDTLYVIDSPQVNNIVTTVGDNGKADVLAANQIIDLLDETNIDSSYASTYFPWIQINTDTNSKIFIPPTGEVLKAMAYTDKVSFPWFAVAGLNRGTITKANKSQYKLSLESRDILYDGRINPIVDFAESGTAIFGQKTLQSNDTALNRINVRRLLLQIKVLISNISSRLLFEQNDQSTIDEFLNSVNPILENIKNERGLTDFRIKMDSTNNTTETMDKNELYGEIYIKPTRSLEFIGVTFTVTPTGASFND